MMHAVVINGVLFETDLDDVYRVNEGEVTESEWYARYAESVRGCDPDEFIRREPGALE